MRAPMCYVLAVVLRISMFSVSMGFSINLKSTSARSASLSIAPARFLRGLSQWVVPHGRDLELNKSPATCMFAFRSCVGKPCRKGKIMHIHCSSKTRTSLRCLQWRGNSWKWGRCQAHFNLGVGVPVALRQLWMAREYRLAFGIHLVGV